MLMYRERAKGWLKHIDFIALDVLCLQIAYLLAYVSRHGWRSPYRSELYQNMTFVLILLDIAIIFFGNIYSNVLRRGYFKEASKTLYQTVLIVGISTFYLFSMHVGQEYSRTVLFLTGVYYFLFSYTVRMIWKHVIVLIRGKRADNALLIATTPERMDSVIQSLEEDKNRRFHIAGLVVMDEGEHQAVSELDVRQYQNIPVVAVEKTLLDYIRREWVDEILFVLPNVSRYQDLVNQIAESGIAVHESLRTAHSVIGKKQVVERIGEFTVMTTTTNYVTFRDAFLKRTFDVIGGLVGSILALVALLLVGPVIYAQSPGPVLFKQQRVGRNGRTFNCWKIRSMVLNADAMKQELMEQNRVKDGMMFKLDFDPRIIGARRLPDGTIKKGVGNFIRDWSIDELPQFFNVLKGEMSLVGTRPPTIDEWEKYQLHQRARLSFKPGITGLWQVSGRSEITDFNEVVRLDMKYINEWSLGLDIRILLKTIQVVFAGRGAM